MNTITLNKRMKNVGGKMLKDDIPPVQNDHRKELNSAEFCLVATSIGKQHAM